MPNADGQERQRQHELALAEQEGRRKAAEIMALHHRERELFAASALRDLSKDTLKTSFTINTGAIIAILTLLGAFANTTNNIDVSDFLGSLICFALGALLAAISMFVAFINYRANFYASYDRTIHFNRIVWSPEESIWNDGKMPEVDPALGRGIQSSRKLAEVGWATSVFVFGLGIAFLIYEMQNFIAQAGASH